MEKGGKNGVANIIPWLQPHWEYPEKRVHIRVDSVKLYSTSKQHWEAILVSSSDLITDTEINYTGTLSANYSNDQNMQSFPVCSAYNSRDNDSL